MMDGGHVVMGVGDGVDGGVNDGSFFFSSRHGRLLLLFSEVLLLLEKSLEPERDELDREPDVMTGGSTMMDGRQVTPLAMPRPNGAGVPGVEKDILLLPLVGDMLLQNGWN
jgi:hypothetical protein